VSKWEREEGVPDIYILKEIADLYGVTVNDLISENQKIEKKSKIKTILSGRNKILISLLAAVFVWAIATTVYVILDLTMPNVMNHLTNIYIYAIPISCTILIIFNSIWGKRIINFFLVSALIWTFTLSLYVSFSISGFDKLFIIPIPLQILTILAFLFGKNKVIKQ
jgi:transcriptional regulator with XRE-family HTH domain